jgi:SAM-dependent methyltransferase
MHCADYNLLCSIVGHDPSLKHRKIWEYAYIYAALRANGCISPGLRGVGFGTGKETLPSAFAARGIRVIATDAPMDLVGSPAWASSDQWTQNLSDLHHSNLVEKDTFDRLVEYETADMNNIPRTLRDFDFCWSSCCLEHLGSIRLGLDFIKNSLDTLKPGGVAVHTTEFNLSYNDTTMESPALSLFRKQDLELVAHELTQEGHEVAPLNFWPGANSVDEFIDLPPYSLPHLKLEIGGYTITSFGMIVRKAR